MNIRKNLQSNHHQIKTVLFVLFLFILQSAMVYYKFEVKAKKKIVLGMPVVKQVDPHNFKINATKQNFVAEGFVGN